MSKNMKKNFLLMLLTWWEQ